MYSTIKLGISHINDILDLELKHHPDGKLYFATTYDEIYTLIQKERCAYYWIYDGHDLVAYGAFDGFSHQEEWSVKIIGIVIHTDYRGQSMWTFLLKKIIHEIQLFQATKIYLTVASENDIAYSLYEHYGFVKYDFKKDVYGPWFDRIYMEYRGEEIN